MTFLAMCVAFTTSVTITGNYLNLQWYENGPKVYTFRVGGVVVSEPNDYTVGIIKLRAFQGTNVQCLMMDFNKLKYLPANYTQFFPIVLYLIVRSSHVKYVTNADFLGLKYLSHLDFQYNEIEHIPANLFQGVSKTLSFVSFADNKITNVGPNFITNIPSLNALFMVRNPCIDLEYPVPFNTFKTTFRTKCQQPIVPDVNTNCTRTPEDHKSLNATVDLMTKIATDDLMTKIANLASEVTLLNKTNNDLNKGIEVTKKLSLDLNKCKMSSAKLQTELTKFRTRKL